MNTQHNKAASTMKHEDNSNLIRVNDELALSPRLYRIASLIARTSWGDDLDWYLEEQLDHLLKEGRFLLHEYTYCVRHGITRKQYDEMHPITILEL